MNSTWEALLLPAFVALVCGLTWLAIVRWQCTARCVVPLAVAVLLLPVSFSTGALWGRLNNNYCYTAVIETLGQAAVSAAQSGQRKELERFAGTVRSLPLWGYETECGRVRAGLSSLQANRDVPAGGE